MRGSFYACQARLADTWLELEYGPGYTCAVTIDAVYFVYGLAFFSLGHALLEMRESSELALGRQLPGSPRSA